MRWMIFVTLLGACDLEPPPRARPAAAPAPAPAPTPAPGSGSGSAIEISDACEQAGVHAAEALIADAKDETERSFREREKARTVRRTGEDCMTRRWTDDAIKCFQAAKTVADLRACEPKLPTQPQPERPPPPPNPPTGSNLPR